MTDWTRTDLGATVPQGSMGVEKIREASFDKVVSHRMHNLLHVYEI